MARVLMFLTGFVTFVTFTAAAPVPKHLMPKEQPVPFPTTVGTTWVYEVAGGEHTRVITDSKAKDGTTRVTSEWRDAQGNKFTDNVWSITAEGVFSVSSGNVTYDPPWCVLKYPYREGQSWPTNERANGTDYLGTRTAGPMERVKVPAGEFNAVRVSWVVDFGDGRSHRTTLWYAPGVGQVKVAYLDGDGKETSAVVLKSFTLGKK